jgi:RNA polymerase sigma factor (sigma-70 family)
VNFQADGAATVDLGRRGSRKTMAPTRLGRTVAVAGATLRPGATRVVTAPPLPRPARPQPAKAGAPGWLIAVLAVVVLAVGWLVWKSVAPQAPATPPRTLAAATPTPAPTVVPVSTPSPPPATAVPPPTFEEAGGKAAAQIRAAQAAFKAGSYDRSAKVSTWILAIAYRQALKALRGVDDAVEFTEARADGADGGPEGAVLEAELRARLRRALGGLSPEHRAVIELTYYLGYSCAEIAAIMECPVDTVKTRMFYARRRLKGLLGMRWEEAM